MSDDPSVGSVIPAHVARTTSSVRSRSMTAGAGAGAGAASSASNSGRSAVSAKQQLKNEQLQIGKAGLLKTDRMGLKEVASKRLPRVAWIPRTLWMDRDQADFDMVVRALLKLSDGTSSEPVQHHFREDIIVDDQYLAVSGLPSDLLDAIGAIANNTHRRIQNLASSGIEATTEGQWTRVVTRAIELLIFLIDTEQQLMPQDEPASDPSARWTLKLTDLPILKADGAIGIDLNSLDIQGLPSYLDSVGFLDRLFGSVCFGPSDLGNSPPFPFFISEVKPPNGDPVHGKNQMVTLMMLSLEAWVYTKERVKMARDGGIDREETAADAITEGYPAVAAGSTGLNPASTTQTSTSFQRPSSQAQSSRRSSQMPPPGTPALPSGTTTPLKIFPADVHGLVEDSVGIDTPSMVYGLLAHGATWTFYAMSRENVEQERSFSCVEIGKHLVSTSKGYYEALVVLAGIIKIGLAYRDIIRKLLSTVAADQRIHANLRSLGAGGEPSLPVDQGDAGAGGGTGGGGGRGNEPGGRGGGTGGGGGRGNEPGDRGGGGSIRGQKRPRNNSDQDQYCSRPPPSRSATSHPAPQDHNGNGESPGNLVFEFEEGSDEVWEPSDRISQWWLPAATGCLQPRDAPPHAADDTSSIHLPQEQHIDKDATAAPVGPRVVSTSTQHTLCSPDGLLLPAEFREPVYVAEEKTEWCGLEYPLGRVDSDGKGPHAHATWGEPLDILPTSTT